MYPHSADFEEDVDGRPLVAPHDGAPVNGGAALDECRADGLDLMRFGLVWLFLLGLPLVAITGVRPRSGGADKLDPVKSPRLAARRQAEEQPRRLPSPRLADEAWFQAAQDQLRRQGAVYVRLEKWHSDPAVYCFSCRCAEPAADVVSDRTGELSALSTSPQQAVHAVIRRLEMPAFSRPPSSAPGSSGDGTDVATDVDGGPPIRLEERQADRFGRP